MLSRLANRITYLYLLRTLWRLTGNRSRLVAVYSLTIFSNLIGLAQPLITGKIVTILVRGDAHILRDVSIWLAILLANQLSFWVFFGPSRVIERRLAFDLRESLTEKLYRQVTALPWHWHQLHHTGDTLNRLSKATMALFYFTENQYAFIEMFVALAGSVVALIWIAPALGFTILICIPFMIRLHRSFDRKMIAMQAKQNIEENAFVASLIDYIGNIGTVLTLRLDRVSRLEIMQRLHRVGGPFFRNVTLNEQKWFSFSMALHVVTAAGLIIFVWEKSTFGGVVSAGLFVAVSQYLWNIEGAVRGFGEKHQQLLNYRVDFSGIEHIEAAYAEYGSAADLVAPDWQTARAENIVFRYEDQEHHLHRLDGVSLDLARGRKIALVGESGAGKSTLLRLLRGLHEPLSGTLVLDGIPQAGFTPLAAGSTLVPQDAEIFENTLRYNITCGVAENAARLQGSVEMACLPAVLEGLPQGLDTDIRERGVNLSGGQKQRLALARGLYAAVDSSLLLLDEPTSSLDPATEAEVFNRLLAGFPNACIVASLHRLHLLDRFDHIYVLADGKVMEEGSFNELLAAEGALFRLWQAQAKE